MVLQEWPTLPLTLASYTLCVLEVCCVHLLEEYEGEDSMGPDAGVVGQESLPERQDSFVAEQILNHRQLAFALRGILDSVNEIW